MTFLRSARRRSRNGIGPWLAVPAVLLFAVFVLYPLARSIQLSFFGSDLLGNPTRFVGFANYLEALVDTDLLRAIVVSIVIALLSMVLATGLALVAVLLLRGRMPGGAVFNTLLSLPFAYSAATASAVFAGLFAPTTGILNTVLGAVGIEGPSWTGDPVASVWAIAITTAWYEFGFAFLVLTAAIRDLPEEVVEAAMLDRANGWTLSWRILVPMMKPSILFLVIAQTISGLQTFTQIHVITRGGPSGATESVVYRLYEFAFGNGNPDFGRASVLAVVLILLIALVTALQFRFFRQDRTS